MPDVPGEEAAKLLDQAEDIINAVGPDVLAEVRKEDERKSERSVGGVGSAEPDATADRRVTPSAPGDLAGDPGGRDQLPVNSAGRFSMKAVIASVRSSEARNPAFQVAT